MYADLADPATPFRLARVLRNRHLDAFCLNDTDSDAGVAAEQEALLADFLPAYLPFAAPFERRAAAGRPAADPQRSGAAAGDGVVTYDVVILGLGYVGLPLAQRRPGPACGGRRRRRPRGGRRRSTPAGRTSTT